MHISDFDFELPEELIAQEPAPERDESRLMVVFKDRPDFEHRKFKDIVEYLRPGDLLVINDTKVIPARLWGRREDTGSKVEVLLLTKMDFRRWKVLVRPGKKARPGTVLVFGDGVLVGRVIDSTEEGGRVIEFTYSGDFERILEQVGEMPLPPYIKKMPPDPGRYQTVYAQRPGSVAAPTAGLHFTPALLENIRAMGVEIARVLLHVGLGTFRPVRVEDITKHRMHEEYYEVPEDTAAALRSVRRAGGRIVAVGTTTTRCLEAAATEDGTVISGSGWASIFIYPGYRFKVVDALITNFHLPRSTVLMMVAALAGREKILRAYRVAIEMRYRFFSFGDAMLII